jgi:hypothetical protein
MNKNRKIPKLILDDIAGFFPYFFGFYILSLLAVCVIPSWRSFFNWELYTLCVIVLGVGSLFSKKPQPFFRIAARCMFESRIPAVWALALLASCPIFLLFKNEVAAESFAVYAYYLLVITVVMQVARQIKENRRKLPCGLIHR